MTLDELVDRVKKEQVILIGNQTVRDACGEKKLFDSVKHSIKGRLSIREIPLASTMSNNQEDCCLLFDNSADSKIRLFFDFISEMRDGKLVVINYQHHDLPGKLRNAVDELRLWL